MAAALAGLSKDQLLERVTIQSQKVKFVAEEHPKLSLIKENAELVKKIDELGIELEEQKDKITKALFGAEHASTVEKNIKSLALCIEDCLSYFDELNNTTVMFLTKPKLKRKAETLTQSLRSKMTQLLTSVTLELLLQSSGDGKPTPQPKILSDEKDWPDYYTYFYGLLGHPINYSIVVESSLAGAEEGYPRAMLMLAKCYAGGLGIEEDKTKAIEWLEKASDLELMEAKIDLAMLLITSMKNRKDACMRVITNPSSKKKTLEDEQRSGHGGFALLAVSAAQQERDKKEDDKLLTRATELLLVAADQGFATAETYLGVISEDSLDYDEAVKWFGFAAKRGCADAINRLGLLHYFGRGIPKSVDKAFALFVQSAAAGNRDALNNVGTCYENGEGIVRNLNEALINYEKGAKRGCPDSMYSLGYLLIKRYIVSLQAVGESSSGLNSILGSGPFDSDQRSRRFPDNSILSFSNSSYGEMRQGSSYRISSRDREELQRVATEGIRWLRAAAEQGIIEASYQLGRVYQQGIGTPVDLSSAFVQFEWAAKQGHVKAAGIAGDMKYGGVGTLEDHVLAAFLYRIAAEGGLANAMNSLGVLLENGSGCVDKQPQVQEAAKWFFEATRLGYSDAAINLANLLARVSIPRLQIASGEVLTASQIRQWLEDNVTVNAKHSGQFDRALALLDHALLSGSSGQVVVRNQQSSLMNQSIQSDIDEMGYPRDDYSINESAQSLALSTRQKSSTEQSTPTSTRALDISDADNYISQTQTRQQKPEKPSKWSIVQSKLS